MKKENQNNKNNNRKSKKWLICYLCFLISGLLYAAYEYIIFPSILLRLSEMKGGLIPSSNATSLKKEIFHEYVCKRFEKLRTGLDASSNEVLDFVIQSMEYAEFDRYIHFVEAKINIPKENKKHAQQWRIEKKSLGRSYKFDEELFAPEAFYFHHGLRFANQKIKEYVKNRDIIDCGAFIGDSLLVLRPYTNKTVYCYEFSKPNLEKFNDVIKDNYIQSGYKLLPLALGEKVEDIFVKMSNKVSGSTQLCRNKKGSAVHITTIDEEVKKHNMDVGFIKMDVEGAGLKIVKGAINTIKEHRPVLALAVYHNIDEMLGIKPLLEENIKDYVYEFHLLSFQFCDFVELTLFAYPKELAN